MIKRGEDSWEGGHIEESPSGWEERYDRVDGIVKQGKV